MLSSRIPRPCISHSPMRRVSLKTASVSLRATAGDSPLLSNVAFINKSFNDVDTEAQFLGVLQQMVEKGRCPAKLMPLWQDFFNNYKKAIIGSNQEGANERLVAQVQATIADCVLNQFVAPYEFPSLHQRILEPYDYFAFGQRYVASLTDFSRSVLGQPQRWAQINKLLEAGENVILLANHQTEADPGVFAHMLKDVYPKMSTDVIYVAGDRVVTDPLCKPFSMGRNLFCVHSKKHMDDIPELKAAKMETNRKTLVAMQRKLNEGGCLIWIAPSGGRDRPKENGKWAPDNFDPAAVDLMKSLALRAKRPSHLFPMAMFSHPMMPPPTTIDKAVGERRMTHFTPVGISVCEELNVASILATCGEDKEQQQKAVAGAAFDAVVKEYQKLEEAIFTEPSKRNNNYIQPWAKAPALA